MALPWLWKHTKRRHLPGCAFFEDGDVVCNLEIKQIYLTEDDLYPSNSKPCSPLVCSSAGCTATFQSLTSYENHYNTKHRHTCRTCKRSFPTSHLVNLHILETHDSLFPLLATKQAMFECLLEACKTKFISAAERKRHMIGEHKYPASFRFTKTRRPKTSESKKEQEEKMDTDVAVAPDNDNSTRVSTNCRKFTYSVPKNISFGHGVGRGFLRPQRTKKNKKHWHQVAAPADKNTQRNIEDISLKDLAEFMES